MSNTLMGKAPRSKNNRCRIADCLRTLFNEHGGNYEDSADRVVRKGSLSAPFFLLQVVYNIPTRFLSKINPFYTTPFLPLKFMYNLKGNNGEEGEGSGTFAPPTWY